MPAPTNEPAHRPGPVGDFEDMRAAFSIWEPSLELDALRACPRLYEPDGTLYAVCLSPTATLTTDRREVVVRRGDLVILPRAVGVDVHPSMDAITVRHDGPQPFHFRERFIQVWTFEHIPAPAPSPAAARHTLLETSGLLHRIGYAIVDVLDDEAGRVEAGDDCLILVGLEGRVGISLPGGASNDLLPGKVIHVPQGGVYRAAGSGRFGELAMTTQLAHEGRALDRRRDARRTSPEFGGTSAEVVTPAQEDVRGNSRA
jgi:hypothetical protein